MIHLRKFRSVLAATALIGALGLVACEAEGEGDVDVEDEDNGDVDDGASE